LIQRQKKTYIWNFQSSGGLSIYLGCAFGIVTDGQIAR
jgi:hypothetical protein